MNNILLYKLLILYTFKKAKVYGDIFGSFDSNVTCFPISGILIPTNSGFFKNASNCFLGSGPIYLFMFKIKLNISFFTDLLKINKKLISIPRHFIIRYNWSISEFPGNNGCDVSISSKIHPIAHISTGFPYSVSPTNNSGDRYHLVATYSVYFAPGPA